MKKIAIILCGLGLGLLNLSAQETKETVPPLSGWKYYGGDEFNGTAINRKLWGIYGDKTRDYFCDVYGNNKNQGMAQTYRDNMINVQDGLAIVRATRSKIFTGLRSDYTEKMRFLLSLGMVIQTMDGGQGSYPVRMHRQVIRMNRIKR